MNLYHFSLQINKKELLCDVSVSFKKGINHLLGRNGTGKTCLAKALYGVLPYTGKIEQKAKSVVLIGSYSGLPLDLCVKDILGLALKNSSKKIYEALYIDLGIADIPINNRIKQLSDGQKQKLKLLFFLVMQPELIILDEFSNALDKSTCILLYRFFNEYVARNDVNIINITHNMSDIEYMPGVYFLLENCNLVPHLSKEAIIDSYIRG